MASVIGGFNVFLNAHPYLEPQDFLLFQGAGITDQVSCSLLRCLAQSSIWERTLIDDMLYIYIINYHRCSSMYSNGGIATYSNNKPPIFDAVYHPFVVIRGTVYYCYANITMEPNPI